jgi:hypothetical protein
MNGATFCLNLSESIVVGKKKKLFSISVNGEQVIFRSGLQDIRKHFIRCLKNDSVTSASNCHERYRLNPISTPLSV